VLLGFFYCMKFKNLLKEHVFFIVIVSVCCLLRFAPLFEYQFTYDELSGMARTDFNSFNDLIKYGVKLTDTHPALIQLLLFVIVKCFGDDTWIIKLPFILFSISTLFYAYCLCLRNFNKKTGIVATMFFSFSFIFVYYAPIARMYVSGLFFSMALLYYFFEIFFNERHCLKNYFWYGFFALLCALNQHISALFAFTVCASAFLFIKKKYLKHYVITCFIIVLAYVPHLPITLYQLNIGGIGFNQGGWLAPPDNDALFKLIKVLMGTGKSFIVFGGFILLNIFLKRNFRWNKKQIFLLSIFLLNYAVVHIYSVASAPLFQYSVMMFASVAFIILVSSKLDFNNEYIFLCFIVFGSSILLYKSYFKKDYFNESVKTVFEYQFERTSYYRNLHGEKKVDAAFFDADNYIVKLYSEKYEGNFSLDTIGIQNKETLKNFTNKVATSKAAYFIVTSAFPLYEEVVMQYFPCLIESNITQANNFKVYSKLKGEKTCIENHDLFYNSIKNNLQFEIRGDGFQQYKYNEALDSLNEFPLTLSAPLNKISYKEGQVIVSKITIKNIYSDADVTLVNEVNDTAIKTGVNYDAKNGAQFFTGADSNVTIVTNSFCGSNYNEIKDRSNFITYLWNNNKAKFVLKNYEIKTIDYWPQKWALWD
jgi:hypothetical protein